MHLKLADVAFSIARGTAINLGYLGLCGLLMVAAGAFCVAVAAVLPGPGLRSALALFVAAHGAVDPETDWQQVATGLATAGIAWSFLAPKRIAAIGLTAVDAGAIVGAALCAALVLWAYSQGPLGVPSMFHGQDVVLDAIAFSLVLVSASGWEFARHRVPALLSAAFVSWIVLALGIAGTALAFQRLRPQSTSVQSGPSPASSASLPDVLVLVLDTVRADHLATYGYGRDTTPHLRRLLAKHPEAV